MYCTTVIIYNNTHWIASQSPGSYNCHTIVIIVKIIYRHFFSFISFFIYFLYAWFMSVYNIIKCIMMVSCLRSDEKHLVLLRNISFIFRRNYTTDESDLCSTYLWSLWAMSTIFCAFFPLLKAMKRCMWTTQWMLKFVNSMLIISLLLFVLYHVGFQISIQISILLLF